MKRIGAGLVIAAAACSPTDLCHQGIWLEASPADTTLALGESFEPRVWIERCPDPRPVNAVLTTEDSGVVQITNALIKTSGVGEAEVTATAGEFTAVIRVEVVD